MGGGLVDDQFEGRPHVRGDQMPAADCPVASPEHDVGVDGRVTVLLCDVTVEGKQFHLLCDRDLSKLVCFPVKPRDGGAGEAADAGQTRGGDPLLITPARQPLHDLVADVKDEHELCAVLGFG